MDLNIKHIPFSRYGSYLSISYLPERTNIQEEGIYLRNIRGGDDGNGAIFKLDVIYNDECVDFEPILHPTFLELKAEEGSIKMIFADQERIRFYGKNVGLRLTMVVKAYDSVFPYKEESWQFNSFSQRLRIMVSPITGAFNVDAPWNVNRSSYAIADCLPDESSGEIDFLIEEFISTYTHKNQGDFETNHLAVQKEFDSWLDQTLPVPSRYENGRNLASYITWSCVVRKEGFLSRPAMYMSKNWMTNIWSWDHCFNAMALVKHNPKLAWDQLMVIFDKQDASGLLPDYINNQYAYWNCSKPPIHGWTLSWMLEKTDGISTDQLNEIYAPLSKWTNWFLEHRDDNGNGIPEYHHGNDSGWDNSTVFHRGVPVESPDLCAFIVLQMESLAEIAGKLNFTDDEKDWKDRAAKLLKDMIDYFWDGNQFTAKYRNEQVDVGDSLLLYMPIVLGKRLPEKIRTKLIEGLKDEDRFLTKHGLATENVNSTFYTSDGYWRGPIWAPSTMLLIDGLRASGETEFARDLAERFCDMANQNGMAENFNALTGKGLRDRAFTWTSSVFLILANEYCMKK